MTRVPDHWRRHLLTAACVAAGGVAYAAVVMQSTSYLHMPEVLDKSGGVSTSTSYVNLVAVDEGAIGPATSTSYQSDVGFMYLLGSAPWVVITSQPSPPVVGPGGSSSVTWQSSFSGTYVVTQGGGTVASGTVTAGTPVTTNLPASALSPNVVNTIFITVTATSPPAGTLNPYTVSTTVVDDRTAPTISAFALTRVAGRVVDPAITSVTIKIAGQPDQVVPVTAGAFSYTFPTGTTLMTIEAGGAVRVVEVQP